MRREERSCVRNYLEGLLSACSESVSLYVFVVYLSILNNTELVCCRDTTGTLSCRVCLHTQQPSQHTKERGWRCNPL